MPLQLALVRSTCFGVAKYERLLLTKIIASTTRNVHNLPPNPSETKANHENRMAATTEQQIKRLAEAYERDGFGVVQNFLSNEEVEALRGEAGRLIREESRSKFNKSQVFGNDFNIKSRYFLNSSDTVCYFFEKNAVNWETKELQLPEEQSLAKIAHALHCLNPVFKRVTTNERVQQVYKTIGFKQPTVVQSMVIFKNPKVGGAYSPHQDASFLYAEPAHLAGLWFALDEATPENGCLEFIPGSHKWPLARRLVRTENTDDGENLLEWTAPVKQFDESQFVKVPVKRGDMVLIHGLVVHRSAANTSEKPRWIYTFHAYDKARSEWSKKNWLQMNVNDTFMPLYSSN